jgi:hypothetical protein
VVVGVVMLWSCLAGTLDLIIEAATNRAQILRFTAIALRNENQGPMEAPEFGLLKGQRPSIASACVHILRSRAGATKSMTLWSMRYTL